MHYSLALEKAKLLIIQGWACSSGLRAACVNRDEGRRGTKGRQRWDGPDFVLRFHIERSVSKGDGRIGERRRGGGERPPGRGCGGGAGAAEGQRSRAGPGLLRGDRAGVAEGRAGFAEGRPGRQQHGEIKRSERNGGRTRGIKRRVGVNGDSPVRRGWRWGGDPRHGGNWGPALGCKESRGWGGLVENVKHWTSGR